MALVDQDLKDDIETIFTDPHPATASAAAQAWTDAVDDYWVTAQSNGITVTIPPTAKATMKTALDIALADGSIAGAALGLKDAIFNYINSCTFGAGTCDPVDDVTGATFQASMVTEFGIITDNPTTKAASIGTNVATLCKSFRGNFPPPDPNHFAIV